MSFSISICIEGMDYTGIVSEGIEYILIWLEIIIMAVSLFIRLWHINTCTA